MSLTFHFLNVGQGSSVVIERTLKNGKCFGLVDSNALRGEVPKALSKLKQLGATSLSFACLTHPDRDHYSGLYSIFCKFKVEQFYTCPFGSLLDNRPRLKDLSEKLVKLVNTSQGESQRQAALELLQIIRWADSSDVVWDECSGEQRRIAPQGFIDVEINSILPPSRVTGGFVERLERNDPFIIGNVKNNDLSLALSFDFAGHRVLLGGDSTNANWQIRKKFEDKIGSPIHAQVVNLPHHGSRKDNQEDVLKRMFSVDGARYAITSANGVSHPSPEVIQWAAGEGIDPFCTNLMEMCGGGRVTDLNASNIDPTLARMLKEVTTVTSRLEPCQGDITVKIEDSGVLSVTPEFAHICPYRLQSPLF